jgi:hypothetical protein
MEDESHEEAPLEAEAAKRDEWRGGSDGRGRESEGRSRPGSESEPVSDEEHSSPSPRTIAPPD